MNHGPRAVVPLPDLSSPVRAERDLIQLRAPSRSKEAWDRFFFQQPMYIMHQVKTHESASPSSAVAMCAACGGASWLAHISWLAHTVH